MWCDSLDRWSSDGGHESNASVLKALGSELVKPFIVVSRYSVPSAETVPENATRACRPLMPLARDVLVDRLLIANGVQA